jgi:spermidine/putrescine transport system ATP-binding protein
MDKPKIGDKHQFDVELINVTKEFVARRGDAPMRAVDNISLSIPDGEFFALLGPSGCGKTTTLRMIAGFDQPSSGRIVIRGREVQNVPPFHRPVNTVFQDYALFPHMNVLQNVMFGLEMEGRNGAEARKAAIEALELVKLGHALDRRPRQMSGGQQQRVALARALVKKPAVLLLDEPLGALDLKLRKEMQDELKTMQRQLGMTFVFVTHDQEEALTMADRIAVMDKGKVLQLGTPEEIYETPNTRFVADFIGETNFITGRLSAKADDRDRATVTLPDGTPFLASADEAIVGNEVVVALRPEKITLFDRNGAVKYPDGTLEPSEQYKTALQKDPDINVLPAVISEAVYIGTDIRYTVRLGANGEGGQVVARVQNYGLRSDTSFTIGQAMYVFWDYEAARVLVR